LASTLTDYQRDILARTLLGEAAGEGLGGMEAVAHVIQNRVNSGQFPTDPAAVALQPNQFSAWNSLSNGGNNLVNRGPGDPGYSTALQAVDAVFGGNSTDPTGGALNYWAPQGMPGGRDPSWAQGQDNRVQIGHHVFLARGNVGTTQDTGFNPLAAPAPLQPAQITVHGGAQTQPAASGSGEIVRGTSTGQQFRVGDIVQGSGGRSFLVADDGTGHAKFVKQLDPFEIPGVINPVREANANTIAGGMIRSMLPAGMAGAAQSAYAGLGGLKNNAVNAASNLGTSVSGLFGNLGSLFSRPAGGLSALGNAYAGSRINGLAALAPSGNIVPKPAVRIAAPAGPVGVAAVANAPAPAPTLNQVVYGQSHDFGPGYRPF